MEKDVLAQLHELGQLLQRASRSGLAVAFIGALFRGHFPGNHVPCWLMSSCCLGLVCSLLCPWHLKETIENKNYLFGLGRRAWGAVEMSQSVKCIRMEFNF